MERDGVANIVDRLRERGFDPRKVGHDSWEARCPVHRSADHALAITRNELNHVLLECRSTQNCQYSRIIGSLGFTSDHVYAESSDWLIGRLSRVPIQPASFGSSGAMRDNGASTSAAEGANGSAGTPLPQEEGPSADTVTLPNTVAQLPGATARVVPCHRRHPRISQYPHQQTQPRPLNLFSPAGWNSTYQVLL